MRLRFKILFWSGLVMFFVVTAIASYALFELREVMLIRRYANQMQTTLHSTLESLQEADIVFLQHRGNLRERDIKKIAAMVGLAHQKAVILTHIEVPNHEIHKEIVELEKLINDKVKTEDEYTASDDMFDEPVVKKVTTMRDNLVLTDIVQDKINNVDHLLSEYQSQHLAYADQYFNMNLAVISFGVLLSFSLFFLFARLVSKEIERRSLLEIELRKAQDAAISASALKSQFLATVSHEVRTPLNGIIGMSELIREKAQGELKKYASVIHDSGRSLLRIVNDILDFSKIEANRMELELQEVKLSSLLETAAELFSTKSIEKKILFVASYEREFENYFAADGARISQIVHNLVGNAIKFTSLGHVILTGKVLKKEGSGYLVRIAVEDTGTGIAPDKVNLIFQPFQQAQHQREGTGLGLSICKRLVEMMGGSIHFTTQLERGSKFWIDIPLRLLRAAEALPTPEFEVYSYKLNDILERALHEYAQHLEVKFHHPSSISSLPTAEKKTVICCGAQSVKELPPELQKSAVVIDFPSAHVPSAWRVLDLPLTPDRFLKIVDVRTVQLEPGATPSPSQALVSRGSGFILLVEDNITNQILAQTQLEQLGYRVHVAENGRACLAAMKRINYDLILMDCRMPELDGFETTKIIRERERTLQAVRVPIIAITANALEGDRNRCLASGMDDYMTKPFDLRTLHERIQKWMAVEKLQIDWRVVGDLANRTSNDVVARLIQSFQHTLSDALTRIEAAIKSENWAEISALVHPLKSSGAALGAVTLSHLCAEIEAEIDSKQVAQVSLCEQLLTVGHRVLEELLTQTRYQ